MHAVIHDLIFIQIYGAHVQEIDHLMLSFLKQNVTVSVHGMYVRCVVLNG